MKHDQPAVDLVGLVKAYGRGAALVPVLDNLSMTVRRGEFVAIMGPSGSGKTSLLNLMGGLDRPDAGQVRIDGRALDGMTDTELADWRARSVGFVFQFYNLIPVLSALDNVALPLTLSCPGAAERRARASAALELVGLSHRLGHRPQMMSGGEQQRVAIARALVNDPAILVADEPTGNLDERATRGVFQLLRDINAGGTVVVMATHDLDLVRQANYRTIEMRDGGVVYDSAEDEADAAEAGEVS
jgi:putative ABC transport system ATP-binding protein